MPTPALSVRLAALVVPVGPATASTPLRDAAAGPVAAVDAGGAFGADDETSAVEAHS